MLELHGPALRRLTLAYGADDADAQDLLREICFAIWRALAFCRGESSERTFVFRIAHNRGLSHRGRRRPMHEDLTSVEHVADLAPQPDAIAGLALRRGTRVGRRIVGGALRLTGLGLALGLAAGYAVANLLAGQLPAARPSDATTYATVAALVAAGAIAAALLPAGRAARQPPMEAMRAE